MASLASPLASALGSIIVDEILYMIVLHNIYSKLYRLVGDTYVPITYTMKYK